MRAPQTRILAAMIFAGLLTLQGCGGGGRSNSTTGTAPTSTTKSNLNQQLLSLGGFDATSVFTPFGHGTPVPSQPLTTSSPIFVNQLGLWMVLSVSGTTFTETFTQDQAGTQQAGSATYTLDLSSKTLSGAISITKGPYAGLSGTYSQTLTSNGTTGNYSCQLANGTTITCQFTITLSLSGVPTGTGTETMTFTNGYSETGNVTYKADGSKAVQVSDSNQDAGTFNITSSGSGTGTITGPDPGLPAVVSWNNSGTGTVTFDNLLIINFTNWQIPNP